MRTRPLDMSDLIEVNQMLQKAILLALVLTGVLTAPILARIHVKTLRRALAVVGVAFGLLLPSLAQAACMVRIAGTWYNLDGGCSTYPGTMGLCFILGYPTYNSQTDYILFSGGRAWVVQGAKRTPFGSDAMHAGFKSLQSQYGGRQSLSPQRRAEADAALAALASTASGPVSLDTVERFARATGLQIRDGGPSQAR